MKRRFTLFIVVAVIVVAIFYFTGTRGGMARFSPHTLEFQTQSEYTLFFGGLPIYRSGFETTESKFANYLNESGVIKLSNRHENRWLEMFHWNEAWQDGYSLLYKNVIRNNTAEMIIDWSKANPELAHVYWTEGFKYLRMDHPADQWIGQQILNRTWRAQSMEELQKKIAEIIAEGDRERALGMFDPELK